MSHRPTGAECEAIRVSRGKHGGLTVNNFFLFFVGGVIGWHSGWFMLRAKNENEAKQESEKQA